MNRQVAPGLSDHARSNPVSRRVRKPRRDAGTFHAVASNPLRAVYLTRIFRKRCCVEGLDHFDFCVNCFCGRSNPDEDRLIPLARHLPLARKISRMMRRLGGVSAPTPYVGVMAPYKTVRGKTSCLSLRRLLTPRRWPDASTALASQSKREP